MYETLEMVRMTHLPVIVMKKELADIPLFGLLTRRYGVIPVERSAGAKALRALVAAARRRSRRPAGDHLPGRDARSCRRDARP